MWRHIMPSWKYTKRQTLKNIWNSFQEIINTTLEEFPLQFESFRKLGETVKLMKYLNTAILENLYLKMFDCMDLNDFEIQLVWDTLQCSSILKQKCIDRYTNAVRNNRTNRLTTATAATARQPETGNRADR